MQHFFNDGICDIKTLAWFYGFKCKERRDDAKDGKGGDLAGRHSGGQGGHNRGGNNTHFSH